MNDPYFVCEACKVRVEAGYRWAIAHLQHDAKMVEFGGPVRATDVLHYKPFWRVPDGPEYDPLRDLISTVRTFLERHKSHELRFGDYITFPESYFGFEWLDVSPSPDLVPRDFVEELGYTSWQRSAITSTPLN